MWATRGQQLQQRLRQLRRAFSLTLPMAYCVDTAHTALTVHRIAQQRLQELVEEERQQLRADTVAALQAVARRCAARDADFWPGAVSARLGVTGAPAPAAPAPSRPLGGDLWQLLGLRDVSEPVPPAVSAAPEAQQQQPAWAHAHQFGLDAQLLGTAPVSMQVVRVVYVTVDDAASCVARLLTEPPAGTVRHAALEGAAAALGGAAAAALGAADSAREALRERAPALLPELRAVRRSALRFRVGWPQRAERGAADVSGMRQPQGEVDLSALC